MLYISQPVGVGFSYETTQVGAIVNDTLVNTTTGPDVGRFSIVDPDTTNTTDAAAIGTWHILQAFLELSPQLDADIQDRTFNLATER